MVASERSVTGSYLAPYDEYEEMLNFAAEHGVAPQVELFDARDVNEAIKRLRDNSMRYRGVLVF